MKNFVTFLVSGALAYTIEEWIDVNRFQVFSQTNGLHIIIYIISLVLLSNVVTPKELFKYTKGFEKNIKVVFHLALSFLTLLPYNFVCSTLLIVKKKINE